MNLEYQNIKDNGRFIVTNLQCEPSLKLLKETELYKIIWCKCVDSEIIVDGCLIKLAAGDILFCTPDDIVKLPKNNHGIVACFFNKAFYCILENDQEASCMGLLFYGSHTVPKVPLNKKQNESFEAVLTLLKDEFEIRDNIQGEVLRTLLKRMLINATHILKNSGFMVNMSTKQVELLRRFNILLEQHFKEKHQVVDYAELLFKSPKTLSNFFKKHDAPSPLHIINARITIEAKRLLLYSDKSAEEIANELGYNEPSHFSKFFKKQTGVSPLAFRKL
jgi:AraC-like DNA-binding protein